MKSLRSWRRPWVLVAAGTLLAAGSYEIGRHLHGRHLGAVPDWNAVLPSTTALADPLPLGPGREAEGIILAQRKRIMGRMRSLEMVRRTATTIRPLVDRALSQPAVQADLRALAQSSGMTVEQYRHYFAGKQEADLLLESGGDPSARSVSDAIGVAQFLAGTGCRCGLKINLAQSRALSRKMAAIESQMAWLEAQPAEWSKPIPAALVGVLPAANPPRAHTAEASILPTPAPAPADPHVWSRDQWLAYRKIQFSHLAAKRCGVDERYDPGRAITAQTRYLLRLTRRFGGVDWALQAYHGGEAGATKTLGLFASARVRGTLASRGAYRPISYSDLYRRISPTGTPGAFTYLFGRSDDHRYYWWKVLMAERALDLYRKDPHDFERQWRELCPGQSIDAAWYPESDHLTFADPTALRAAYQDHTLISLPRNAASFGIHTANLAVLEPESAGLQKGLRPEAMGTLLRLAQIYRSNGGSEPLVVVGMVQSAEYRGKWTSRYPSPPLPSGVPKDPDTHSTGLVFDVRRPEKEWDRKVLEFAMGRLYDSLRISWRSEDSGGSRRYHIVPNPAYRQEALDFLHKVAR